jgi:hypothetical protein
MQHMNAIKEAQRYIARHPFTESAETLALLVLSLESKEPFALDKLYEMDLERFELAVQILKEWRLDRYFAGKSKLYDLSMQLRDLTREAN